MNTNFHNLTLKELKGICRSEAPKYSGFSYCRKKEELIRFMYQKNSTSQRDFGNRQRSYNLSDFSNIFETEEERDERIQSYYEPKPEDTIIDDLISLLRNRYPLSTVIFDKHNDENNDLIYRGNKGKYISQHGSLGEYGEMILYHGTDGINLPSILNDDFRLTNNPIHGSIYGRGIYFTNDIEKAIYYSERGNSTKYVIVCMVHIGDICQGYSTMNIHPKMKDKDKEYDTSVDNLVNPKQFIKKNNGTYNILGIITLNNINNINSHNTKFSGSFQLINTTKYPISLYWIPPNHSKPKPKTRRDLLGCKKMSDIPASISGNHGTTRQLCQIGHDFVCLFQHEWQTAHLASGVIKRFKSYKRNQIITI